MKKTPSLFAHLMKYGRQYIAGMLCLLAVDYLELFIPQLTGAITDGLTAGGFTLRQLMTNVDRKSVV